MKLLVLSSSPRRDGNSALLARSLADGAEAAGHEVDLLFADDIVSGFLRDCRTCRLPDGRCGIQDRYATAFLAAYLRADGFVAATPVYWYGMSAQLKTVFDRMFCYVAASYAQSAEVVAGIKGKRIGLLLSSEETFPTVAAGIMHQIQEFARYTRSTFAGHVHGCGNARGDVLRDPDAPVAAARRLGAEFFTRHATDYRIDTPRPARMWQAAPTA